MLKSYFKNTKGTFAIKMALMTPLLLLAVGAAVDVSQLVDAHQKLQNFADSSALSAALAYNAKDQEYETMAKTHFDANLNDEFVTLKYKATKTDHDTMFVEAKVGLQPTFMQIFGYPKLATSVTSEVNIGETRITEVALVVDNSASLIYNGGYAPLSAALDVFMNTLTDQDDMGNLYVSFIPWSGTVNVGDAHASWLKPYDSSIYGPDDWHGCVMARAGGLDLTDMPPSGANRFDPFAWPSDPNNNWSGQPIGSYTDYVENVSDETLGPNAGCVMEMVPLTNKRHKITPIIDEYQSNIQTKVGTFTSNALVWGYRALSPKWKGYWSSPTPSNLPSSNGNKIIIFLSDGFARWNDVENPAQAQYSPYGYPGDNFLNISDITDLAATTAEMERRFEVVCDNIKADGIEIYTIGYAMTADQFPIYQRCATSHSHAYASAASSDISNVFKDIAKKVKQKETRIMN